MRYFVYILQSQKDQSYYIGFSSDLDNRLKRHNAGREKYSKHKVPLDLIWYTEKNTRGEAIKLERKLKNFKSRIRIANFIERYS